MPITEKQLQANRRNAQKSTGPKTDSGNANSSRNASSRDYFRAEPRVSRGPVIARLTPLN